MNLRDLTALKGRVERLQQDANKAQGALEQLKQRLLDEFECKTIEEAEGLLEEFLEAERLAKQAFDQEYDRFEVEWGDLLS